MENRKRLILKLSAGLAGLLLVLTFFSNTIHNLNVAGVVVGFDTSGIITTTSRSEGFLEFPHHQNIYAEYGGQIHFFAEDGRHVREGNPLFEIQIDRIQILERMASLRSLTHSLPWANWAEIQREVDRYQRLLNTDGLIREYAPYDGILRLAPDAPEEGRFASPGQRILQLEMMEDNRVMVSAYFPESLGLIPGQDMRRNARLDIPSLNAHGLPGRIEGITPEEGRLRAEISFTVPHRVVGGERVEIIIEDTAPLAQRVLPSYAIREDSQGYFLLYVHREENALLGYSYFARRQWVTVLNRGNQSTSFTIFGEIEGPIILQSDRPLEEGDRIRVVGER